MKLYLVERFHGILHVSAIRTRLHLCSEFQACRIIPMLSTITMCLDSVSSRTESFVRRVHYTAWKVQRGCIEYTLSILSRQNK